MEEGERDERRYKRRTRERGGEWRRHPHHHVGGWRERQKEGAGGLGFVAASEMPVWGLGRDGRRRRRGRLAFVQDTFTLRDELMAPLISSAQNNIKDLNIRFGSLIFEVERRNLEEGVLGSAGNMPVKLTFSGANVGKNKVMKHESGYFREGHEGFVNQQGRGGEARRVSKSIWRPNSSRSQPPRPPGPVWTKIITQATNGLRFR